MLLLDGIMERQLLKELSCCGEEFGRGCGGGEGVGGAGAVEEVPRYAEVVLVVLHGFRRTTVGATFDRCEGRIDGDFVSWLIGTSCGGHGRVPWGVWSCDLR